MNQGQICMSTERLIVDASIADEFVGNAGGRRASTLPAGDPRGHDRGLGLADQRPSRRNSMDELIADAVTKGAKLVAGGKSRDGTDRGSATVLDHVTPDMRIYSEELFGPVKPRDPGQGRGRGGEDRQ